MLTLLLFTGCAVGGNYGTTDRDRDLDNMFRNYEVLADHKYYTSGGYDMPNAILAVHRDYDLENAENLWVVVPNVDYEQMRKWVYNITSEYDYRQSGDYYAAYILDPNGKRVGAWYSNEMHATVKFPDGNRIFVHTPDLDQHFLKGRRSRNF